MPRKPQISIDQGIKELLQLRPRDAFAFLLPDVHENRGTPTSWEFLATQVRKKDLRGKGYVMDLNIRYEFAEGTPILLVLVEHWSQARAVDLIRTAHYYLDLMERFPGERIIPVALITERKAHEIPDQIVGLGEGEEHLRFRTRIVQLAREDAARWVGGCNLVAATLLLAMSGSWSGLSKLLTAVDTFQGCGSDQEFALLFPLFVAVGKLEAEEEETIMSYLATMPKSRIQIRLEEIAREQVLQEGLAEGLQRGLEQGLERGLEQGLERGLEQGLEQGIERGLRQKALEDARKMREHGIEWTIVTDVTGLKPEDLLAD